MLLQELLMHSKGEDIAVARARGRMQDPPVTMHVSHLCGNPQCLYDQHVIIESAVINNSRKNCRVWYKCHGHPGCEKWFMVCSHEPHCIRPLPHYPNLVTWQQVMDSGLIHI